MLKRKLLVLLALVSMIYGAVQIDQAINPPVSVQELDEEPTVGMA